MCLGRRKAAARDQAGVCAPESPLYVGRASDNLLEDAFAKANAAIIPQKAPKHTQFSNRSSEANPLVQGRSETALNRTTECQTRRAPASFQPQNTQSMSTIRPGPVEPTIEFTPSTEHVPPLLAYLQFQATAKHTKTFQFPLSSDHMLLTLIQYNVLRAVISNLNICKLLDIIPTDCQAAIFIKSLPPPSTLPPSFRPTPLQLATPHKPHLDSIPSPQLRDNLILASTQELFDEDEFCDDICGGLWSGYDDTEKKGLLVWGEPWMQGSWEVSEGFARKWGWLLRGCWDLLESTNRWREVRGETRLEVLEKVVADGDG